MYSDSLWKKKKKLINSRRNLKNKNNFFIFSKFSLNLEISPQKIVNNQTKKFISYKLGLEKKF